MRTMDYPQPPNRSALAWSALMFGTVAGLGNFWINDQAAVSYVSMVSDNPPRARNKWDEEIFIMDKQHSRMVLNPWFGRID